MKPVIVQIPQSLHWDEPASLRRRFGVHYSVSGDGLEITERLSSAFSPPSNQTATLAGAHQLSEAIQKHQRSYRWLDLLLKGERDPSRIEQPKVIFLEAREIFVPCLPEVDQNFLWIDADDDAERVLSLRLMNVVDDHELRVGLLLWSRDFAVEIAWCGMARKWAGSRKGILRCAQRGLYPVPCSGLNLMEVAR